MVAVLYIVLLHFRIDVPVVLIWDESTSCAEGSNWLEAKSLSGAVTSIFLEGIFEAKTQYNKNTLDNF